MLKLSESPVSLNINSSRKISRTWLQQKKKIEQSYFEQSTTATHQKKKIAKYTIGSTVRSTGTALHNAVLVYVLNIYRNKYLDFYKM